MAFDQQLDIYLRARFTLLVLVTVEEKRALEAIKTVCGSRVGVCFSWDAAEGFRPITGSAGTLPTAREAL